MSILIELGFFLNQLAKITSERTCKIFIFWTKLIAIFCILTNNHAHRWHMRWARLQGRLAYLDYESAWAEKLIEWRIFPVYVSWIQIGIWNTLNFGRWCFSSCGMLLCYMIFLKRIFCVNKILLRIRRCYCIPSLIDIKSLYRASILGIYYGVK